MKLAVASRRQNASQQYGDRKRKRVTVRPQIKIANARQEKIADDGVEEAPEHIHGRRGKPFARWLSEGRLKGLPHHAADKMRNGVGQEKSSNEVCHQKKPGHGYALLVASGIASG